MNCANIKNYFNKSKFICALIGYIVGHYVRLLLFMATRRHRRSSTRALSRALFTSYTTEL